MTSQTSRSWKKGTTRERLLSGGLSQAGNRARRDPSLVTPQEEDDRFELIQSAKTETESPPGFERDSGVFLCPKRSLVERYRLFQTGQATPGRSEGKRALRGF